MESYLRRWNWLYFAEHNKALATSLLVLGTLIVFTLLFELVLAVLKNRMRKSDYRLPELVRKYCYTPGVLVFIGLGMVVLLPLAPLPRDWVGPVNRFLAIYQIGTIAFLIIRVFSVVREMLYARYAAKASISEVRSRAALTQYKIFERIATFVIVTLAIIFALMTFESVRQFGAGLLASAGVVGIIVGFAAQRSIGTLFAGIQIAVAQPIRLDDVVVVEGEWGRIEEINLTYVIVALWDERRMVVPITNFIDKPFTNWTRNSSNITGIVLLLVDYATPVEEMRAHFLKIIAASTLWDRRKAILQVTGQTDRVMEIRMLVSAENADVLFDLRCEMREKMVAWMVETFPNLLPRGRVTNLDLHKDEGEQAPLTGDSFTPTDTQREEEGDKRNS